jgi:hypothetical protein
MTRAQRANRAAVARTSPSSALPINPLIKARCLLTRRVRPFSRTVIGSPSSAARSVPRLVLPFGRPDGLPDCPRLNRVAFGGRPKPTSNCFFISEYVLVTAVRPSQSGFGSVAPCRPVRSRSAPINREVERGSGFLRGIMRAGLAVTIYKVAPCFMRTASWLFARRHSRASQNKPRAARLRRHNTAALDRG